MSQNNDEYWTNHSYAHPNMATGWKVTSAETGKFLRTLEHDHILCRVTGGYIYLYDRHNKREVEVSLAYLQGLSS